MTLTEESPNDDRPQGGSTYEEVGRQLNAGHIADTVQHILSDTHRELNENMRAIQRLIPYLSGLYYADCQRRYAEKEMFRLQKERVDLEARINNALVMVPDLLYPVTAIAHT